MSNFTEALLKEIQDNYKAYKKRDDMVEAFEKILKSTSYKELYPYSKELSRLAADNVIEVLSQIEGEIYRGTLIEILTPTMQDLHADITVCVNTIRYNKTQTLKSSKKQWYPKLKYNNLPFKSFDAFQISDDISKSGDIKLLTEKLIGYASDTIDSEQKNEIKFIGSSLDTQFIVTRTYDGVGLHDGKDTCIFCTGLVGTRTFDNYKDCMYDDIWRRHGGCACEIDYECKYTGTRSKLYS